MLLPSNNCLVTMPRHVFIAAFAAMAQADNPITVAAGDALTKRLAAVSGERPAVSMPSVYALHLAGYIPKESYDDVSCVVE